MKYIYVLLYLSFFTMACEKDPIAMEKPEIAEDIVLYSSNPNGHNELYRLRRDEKEVVLSDQIYDYWWAKVSPDKNSFLVYRSLADSNKNHDNYDHAELMLYDIDGSNERLLIPKGSHGWISQGVCRWNKDGTKILMGAQIDFNGSSQWRLFTTDINGQNPKMISDRWIIDPNFSHDNEKIIYVGFRDNNLTLDLSKLELHMGDYDAINDTLTNIITLTDNNTRDHDPSFSPKGEKIVFSAGNAFYSDVDIIIYNIRSGQEEKVVDDKSANGGSMCWSPDGTRIYYHSLKLLGYPFRIKTYELNSANNLNLLFTSDNNYGFFHPEVY